MHLSGFHFVGGRGEEGGGREGGREGEEKKRRGTRRKEGESGWEGERRERGSRVCMHIHVDFIYSDSVFFFFFPTSFFSPETRFRGCI